MWPPPSARRPERRFHLSRQEEPRERDRRIFLPSHQVALGRVLWRRGDRRIRVQLPRCFGPNRSHCRSPTTLYSWIPTFLLCIYWTGGPKLGTDGTLTNLHCRNTESVPPVPGDPQIFMPLKSSPSSDRVPVEEVSEALHQRTDSDLRSAHDLEGRSSTRERAHLRHRPPFARRSRGRREPCRRSQAARAAALLLSKR